MRKLLEESYLCTVKNKTENEEGKKRKLQQQIIFLPLKTVNKKLCKQGTYLLLPKYFSQITAPPNTTLIQ